MAQEDEIVIKLKLLNDQFQRGLRGINKTMDSLESKSKVLLKHSLAFTAAASGGALVAVREYQKFELAVAKVNKVADFGQQELKQYEQELRALAKTIPHNTTELAELSEAAAILGIRGAKNLTNFSETMARLGVATDVGGEEAAKSITRILQLSGEGVGVVSNFGSAIVELGNNFKASESEILSNAIRVRQSTAAYKFSSAEILAIGTALRESGVQAELGGTAVGRTMRGMSAAVREGGESLRVLEEITGSTAQQLEVDLKERPAVVFESFVQGLNRLKGEGVDTVPFLKSMGLEGERILAVLPSLAKNSDRLTEALRKSNGAWKANTALTKESNAFYKTSIKQTQLFWNRIKDLGISVGKQLEPSFRELISTGNRFIELLGRPEMVEFIVQVIKGAVVLGTLGTALGIGGIAFAKFVKAATFAIGGVGKFIGIVLKVPAAMGFLIGGIRKAIIAIRAMSLAAKIAVGATGFGLLLIAVGSLYAYWDDIFPKMKTIFSNFTSFISKMGGAVGKILKGVFTFDAASIKEGLGAITGLYKEMAEKAIESIDKVTTKRKKGAEEEVKTEEDKAKKLLDTIKAGDATRDEYDNERNLLKDEAIALRRDEEKMSLAEHLDAVRSLEVNNVTDINDKTFANLKAGLNSKNKLERDNAKKRLGQITKRNTQELQVQRRKTDLQLGIAKSTSQLMTQILGRESKAAFYIQRALALVEIAINTARGISDAASKVATIPLIPWITGLGVAQAAVVAGSAFNPPTGAAAGALVERAAGTPQFGDNQNFRLEPGEVVNPRKNYEQLIEMEMARRGATTTDPDDEQDEMMGGSMVEISFQDDASDFIQAEQREREALGIGVS